LIVQQGGNRKAAGSPAPRHFGNRHLPKSPAGRQQRHRLQDIGFASAIRPAEQHETVGGLDARVAVVAEIGERQAGDGGHWPPGLAKLLAPVDDFEMGGAVIESLQDRLSLRRDVADRIILAHEGNDRIQAVEPHQCLKFDLVVQIAAHHGRCAGIRESCALRCLE
jgi:hypothetical protein